MGVLAAEREDVAQEVFLRLFRGLDGFRSGRPLSSWVYKISVNASLDWRDRRRRIGAGEVPWPDGLDVAGSGRDPGDGQDLARRLEGALEALSERERAVFVLREMEGLETVDVARALGVSQITIRRHLGLARRRLRETLEGKKGTVD
jgi:RNA polymerase sigma-70 factor (ECF subfamily)